MLSKRFKCVIVGYFIAAGAVLVLSAMYVPQPGLTRQQTWGSVIEEQHAATHAKYLAKNVSASRPSSMAVSLDDPRSRQLAETEIQLGTALMFLKSSEASAWRSNWIGSAAAAMLFPSMVLIVVLLWHVNTLSGVVKAMGEQR